MQQTTRSDMQAESEPSVADLRKIVNKLEKRVQQLEIMMKPANANRTTRNPFGEQRDPFGGTANRRDSFCAGTFTPPCKEMHFETPPYPPLFGPMGTAPGSVSPDANLNRFPLFQ